MKQMIIKKLQEVFKELSTEAIEAMADIAVADMEKQQATPAVTPTPAPVSAVVPDNYDFILYSDGSYIKETRIAGWAFLVASKGGKSPSVPEEFSGATNDPDLVAINNVAGELMASMRAIDYAVKNGAKSILVVTDYEGVLKWPNGEWSAKNKYTKMYVHYISRLREKKVNITFKWVKGHGKDALNKRVDALAKAAARNFSC